MQCKKSYSLWALLCTHNSFSEVLPCNALTIPDFFFNSKVSLNINKIAIILSKQLKYHLWCYNKLTNWLQQIVPLHPMYPYLANLFSWRRTCSWTVLCPLHTFGYRELLHSLQWELRSILRLKDKYKCPTISIGCLLLQRWKKNYYQLITVLQ